MALITNRIKEITLNTAGKSSGILSLAKKDYIQIL